MANIRYGNIGGGTRAISQIQVSDIKTWDATVPFDPLSVETLEHAYYQNYVDSGTHHWPDLIGNENLIDAGDTAVYTGTYNGSEVVIFSNIEEEEEAYLEGSNSSWNWMHDGTGGTVIVVFHPTSDLSEFKESNPYILGTNGTAIKGWNLRIWNERIQFFVYGTSTVVLSSSASGPQLDEDNIHIVIARINSEGYSVRVDGAEVLSGSLQSTPASGNTLEPFRVPKPGNSLHGWVGALFGASSYLPDSICEFYERWAMQTFAF